MNQGVSLVWFISAVAGFVSLGMEITWMRVAGFYDGNTPQMFGQILGLFLLGIVFGAMLGKRFSQLAADKSQCAQYGALALLLGGIVDCASPSVVALVGKSHWTFSTMAILVLMTATLKAVVFPIVHHLGSDIADGSTGRSVSRVYFFNIVGSCIAPLLVGFFALDWLGSQRTMIGVGALAIGLAIVWAACSSARYRLLWPVGLVLAATIVSLAPRTETMLHALAKTDRNGVEWLLENRHGVIHVTSGKDRVPAVLGGNAYDGMMTTDPVSNLNMTHRLYWLTALHPGPERVLVIGFSGGAWTEILRHFPTVKQIDVVEINKGYIDLVKEKAPYRELLNDPRITFHFDDGRRWLRANPDRQFDLIVMNNTFHWRAYSTNLLSREVMLILKEHMTPRGLLAFNATGSPDALATAAVVFPHAYRWVQSNFIYAANWDFRTLELPAARDRLIRLVQAMPETNHYSPEKVGEVVDKWLHTSLLNDGSHGKSAWILKVQQQLLSERPLEVITDRNMIVEYRYGLSRQKASD
jgi:spermidine synthase